VTGGGRFNWFTAGPPGKSLTACASVKTAVPAHATAARSSEANVLKMLFILVISSSNQIKQCQNHATHTPTGARRKGGQNSVLQLL